MAPAGAADAALATPTRLTGRPCGSNNVGVAMHDVLCPIVPMFHVNAWGIPYAAAMAGAKLVFPGSRLDGASLQELFEGEGVTCALGVPTVWLGLLQYLETTGKRIDSVKRGTATGDALDAVDTLAGRFEVLEEADPHRRDAERAGDTFALE